MMKGQVTCLASDINMETYHGHVRTSADAIILFEACRIGLLPRVQRRLTEKERQSIRSGSVFVWDELEAGMRRWTDGKSWSASRVSGSFLTYREMEGKRGGNSMSPLPCSDNKKGSEHGRDQSQEGSDGNHYKPHGLVKQSFSSTTSSGHHLHLISYFSHSANGSQNLTQPSSDGNLRHIRPQWSMYPESTVRNQNSVPAVTREPMTSFGSPTSPHQSVDLSPSNARSATSAPAYSGHGQPDWTPPSPMHTPPQCYAPYHAGEYDQQSPLKQQQQQLQHVEQRPLQQIHYPAYSHQSGPSPQPRSQIAFHRTPGPLSKGSLPSPPPRPQQHGQYSEHQRQLPAIHPQHSISVAEEARYASVKVNPEHDDTRPRVPGPYARSPGIVPTLGKAAVTIPSIQSLINNAQAPSVERTRTASHRAIGPSTHRLQHILLHRISCTPQHDTRALRDLDKAMFRV